MKALFSVFLTVLVYGYSSALLSVPFRLKSALSNQCGQVKQQPPWFFNKLKKMPDLLPVEGGSMEEVFCDGGFIIARVLCDDGFLFPDGTNTREVLYDSIKWRGIEGCQNVMCGAPPIANADLAPESNTHQFGQVVNVTCTEGFILSDDTEEYQTKCLLDGSWSRTESCKARLCPSTERSNTNMYKDGFLPDLAYPFTLLVPCSEGFLTAEAGDMYEATCTINGTWNFTGDCEFAASEACPATPVGNTKQENEMLPLTVNGGTVDVVCEDGETIPGVGATYTATCVDGIWDVTHSCGIADCADAKVANLPTGETTIYPDGTNAMEVYCDQDTDGGGWIVFQRRISNSDFELDWVNYTAGFGDASTNFWLGLENIHLLTSLAYTKLKVVLQYPATCFLEADYSSFAVQDSSTKYTLQVSGYIGSSSADDSLTHHNDRKFTTQDQDNDGRKGANCAQLFTGAWWYRSCHSSNLNGQFRVTEYGKGMVWLSLTTHDDSVFSSKMMIRKTVSIEI